MLSDTSYKTRSFLKKPTPFMGGSISQSFRLIIDKPLTTDIETYRRAVRQYEQFNDEYIRRRSSFYIEVRVNFHG